MDPGRAAAFDAIELDPSVAAPPTQLARPPGGQRRTALPPWAISYRYCDSLPAAISGCHTVALLNLPNLMWYGLFGTVTELRRDLQALLESLQQHFQSPRSVQLYPPLIFDELLEFKHRTYERFQAIMLPAVWRPLQGLRDQDLELLAQHLIDQQPAGQYVLKGAFSDAHRSVFTSIHIPPENEQSDSEPVPAGLLAAIDKMSKELNQDYFGLQPFVPSLRLSEYRHWCTAHVDENGERKFRLAITLRTAFTGLKRDLIAGRVSIPSDPPSIACHDLVQSILSDEQYADWRQQLLNAGCFAFRIDCGYDDRPGVIPHAFLNEFAAPTDAAFWSHAHESEFVWALGRFVAEGLEQRLWSH